jgi:hypothetical protein
MFNVIEEALSLSKTNYVGKMSKICVKFVENILQ